MAIAGVMALTMGLRASEILKRKVRDLTAQRLCKLAGTTAVGTHRLRGLYATLAVESGALSETVASSLGHGSFAMTERHYA